MLGICKKNYTPLTRNNKLSIVEYLGRLFGRVLGPQHQLEGDTATPGAQPFQPLRYFARQLKQELSSVLPPREPDPVVHLSSNRFTNLRINIYSTRKFADTQHTLPALSHHYWVLFFSFSLQLFLSVANLSGLNYLNPRELRNYLLQLQFALVYSAAKVVELFTNLIPNFSLQLTKGEFVEVGACLNTEESH